MRIRLKTKEKFVPKLSSIFEDRDTSCEAASESVHKNRQASSRAAEDYNGYINRTKPRILDSPLQKDFTHDITSSKIEHTTTAFGSRNIQKESSTSRIGQKESSKIGRVNLAINSNISGKMSGHRNQTKKSKIPVPKRRYSLDTASFCIPLETNDDLKSSQITAQTSLPDLNAVRNALQMPPNLERIETAVAEASTSSRINVSRRLPNIENDNPLNIHQRESKKSDDLLLPLLEEGKKLSLSELRGEILKRLHEKMNDQQPTGSKASPKSKSKPINSPVASPRNKSAKQIKQKKVKPGMSGKLPWMENNGDVKYQFGASK